MKDEEAAACSEGVLHAPVLDQPILNVMTCVTKNEDDQGTSTSSTEIRYLTEPSKIMLHFPL